MQKSSECGETGLVIHGVTTDGNRFRPSDWAQRLLSVTATFGSDRRLRAHPQVSAGVADGTPQVVLKPCLEREAPELFAFLLDFARGNRLVIHPLQSARR